MSTDALDYPADATVHELDVTSMAPPGPLVETLETLESMGSRAVLVQRNDRAPQHLYPKLEDRGYEYRTVHADEGVVTAIWRP
jgi:TusA-related sulfurtransferase